MLVEILQKLLPAKIRSIIRPYHRIFFPNKIYGYWNITYRCTYKCSYCPFCNITKYSDIYPKETEKTQAQKNNEYRNQIQNKYSTNILVSADQDTDILLNIISKTSNEDIKVQSINSLNSKEYFMYEIKILVPDTEKLENFMNEIRTIPHIIKVERSIK